MATPEISEASYELKKLIIKYSDLFGYHQWPSEHERWVELIFALVSRITDKPESKVREVIENCDALDLLGIEELAKIPEKEKGIDFDSTQAKRIFELLAESGFMEKESKSSILAMHDVAKSLIDRHKGKIQIYLRKYGQRMIHELSQNFSFSEMNKKDMEFAFTYWLQNVLNMPINLGTESTTKFCEKLKITEEEFLNEADNLDINIALLDDMIEQSTKDLEKS